SFHANYGGVNSIAPYINIENLIGSAYGDTLIGNRDANRIDGGNGGDDILTGGAGRDIFVVELGTGKGHDTITDWQRGVDNLVVRVGAELSDLAAAFQADVLDVRKPDSHTMEIFLTATPDEDYITVQFLDTIADIKNFRVALGGAEHIETEVFTPDTSPDII
ncbi:MAG: hypothetical protein HAW65_04540, partial [Alphaproteobacteria bacterium]|nr:hypothetical protein [Alphaproteobacteria bacterium]